MQHKKSITVINTLLLSLTAISFIACGGDNNIEGFDGNSYEEINVSKACTTPISIADYIELKSGDQIVKDEENTIVSIFHDENNIKKVCLKSGTAHINRAYSE